MSTLLEERQTGIGGSDVGALYSLDWGCRLAKWREKRGEPQDFPPEEKPELLRRGRLLEDDAIEEYMAVTGLWVTVDRAVKHHPQYPWALVHIDGWVQGPDDPERGVLEIKVLGRESFRKATKGGLRESYILQLQHAMWVTGASWGSFGVLGLDPWKLAYFDVDRDDAMIEAIAREEEDFWRAVENGPAPEPLPDPKDRRCASCPWRKTCRGQETIEATAEHTMERDPTLHQLAEEYEEARDVAAEAEEYKEEVRARLVAAMGTRQAVDAGGITVHWKPYSTTRWDERALSDRFKRDALFAALLERYRKTTTSQSLRTFRV